MWYRLDRLSSQVQHAVLTMDSEHWIVVSVITVVVGAVFLRGFGSRTSY